MVNKKLKREVPVKQSIQVMQNIWDAYQYEITASSIMYQKVCDQLKLSSRMILKHVLGCPTHGATSSDLPALQLSWNFVICKKIYAIQMKNV
jgi:hypothetical protein